MKPTPDIKKVTQRLRCVLTDEEKLEAGKALAEATAELKQIEEDKTETVAQFKAQTTAAEAKISVLGNKLRSGYELRDVACEIYFGKPKDGQKQTRRMDTKEVIETAPMTEEEKQRQLNLDEGNSQ